MLTKNTIPALVSIVLFALSYVVPVEYQAILRNIGLFAFSGAVTNWLAVHMLFERIPGLYGSGVIPNRFEDLKVGLLKLVKENLFKAENVQKAFDKDHSSSGLSLDFEPLIDSFDIDKTFEQLKEAIMQSSFGSAIAMFGGEAVLEPLRDKFKERLRDLVRETAQSEQFQQTLSSSLSKVTGSDVFLKKIEEIVSDRLEELTPKMVKEIMQDMIRQHLGWLVVWGGVFGGLIGFVVSLI